MTGVFAALFMLQGLATPITLDAKDATLPELVATITAQAGVHVQAKPQLSNLKASVFVKDMPASVLLEKLAGLYDLEQEVDKDRIVLKFRAAGQLDLERFLDADQLMRANLMRARLDALARLTAMNPSDLKSALFSWKKKPGTADDWAAERIDIPSYYALGLWERANFGVSNSTNLTSWRIQVVWSSLHSAPPVFRIGTIELGPLSLRHRFKTCAIDEGSSSLEGSMIGVCCYPTTAEILPRMLAGATKERIEQLADSAFLEAAADDGLERLEFAKRLSKWQSPQEKWPSGDLIETDAPQDPGYFGGEVTLSEKLLDLHNRSGLNIVATSFRAQAIGQKFSRDSASVTEMLHELQKTERAMLNWDGECLSVRHPRFWMLMCSEPPEGVIRAAETAARTRTLTLQEYGELAFAFANGQDDVPPWKHIPPSRVETWRSRTPVSLKASESVPTIPHSFDRLIRHRGIVLRFDPEPLESAYPALFALAVLEPADRANLLACQVVPAHIAYDAADWGLCFPAQISERMTNPMLPNNSHIPSQMQLSIDGEQYRLVCTNPYLEATYSFRIRKTSGG